jgi:hypothetical protein
LTGKNSTAGLKTVVRSAPRAQRKNPCRCKRMNRKSELDQASTGDNEILCRTGAHKQDELGETKRRLTIWGASR